MSLYIQSPNDYIFTPSINITNDILYNPGIKPSTIIKTDSDDIYIISDTPLSPLSPLTPSLRLDYSRPIFGLYEDLNYNKDIIKRMVKYIHLKALDEWLIEDLNDILNYVEIKGNKADLINNLSKYNPGTVHKEDIRTLEKKVDFIERYFLSRSVMHKLIKKFIQESGYNYVDLPHRQDQIKRFIKDKLLNIIKKEISRK